MGRFLLLASGVTLVLSCLPLKAHGDGQVRAISGGPAVRLAKANAGKQEVAALQF
jgi:hypothetical protein